MSGRRRDMFRHGGHEYSVVRMPADGNCLFHSLAYCLRRGASEHRAIRRQAVAYVAANWGHRFGPVLGAFLRDNRGRPVDTAPSYADYMARLGVFGGDPELCAISELYGVRIEVYVARRPSSRPHVYNEHSRQSIRLLFSGSPDYGHYDVVLPVRRAGSKVPAASAKEDVELVSAVNNVLHYTVAFSTLMLLCISFLAMQLSLAPVEY